MIPNNLPESLAVLEQRHLIEVLAALVIESLADDIVLCRLDPGGGTQSLADFEFVGPDGVAEGLLEVTTTTMPARRATVREVAKQDWTFPSLSWSWIVKVLEDCRIKALRRDIEPLLRNLEEEGRTGEWIPGPGHDSPVLPPGLAALGVIAAIAYHRREAGKQSWVSVSLKGQGGAYSLDAVVSAAQTELDKPDNQAKLCDRGHHRRSELFVWLDPGDSQAALWTLTHPPFDTAGESLSSLQLPQGMTAVWLASSGLTAWPRPVGPLLRGDAAGWSPIPPGTMPDDPADLDRVLARLTGAAGVHDWDKGARSSLQGPDVTAIRQ